MMAESDLDDDESPTTQQHIARLAEEVAKRLNQVTATGHSGGGIAPEPQAEPGGARRGG